MTMAASTKKRRNRQGSHIDFNLSGCESDSSVENPFQSDDDSSYVPDSHDSDSDGRDSPPHQQGDEFSSRTTPMQFASASSVFSHLHKRGVICRQREADQVDAKNERKREPSAMCADENQKHERWRSNSQYIQKSMSSITSALNEPEATQEQPQAAHQVGDDSDSNISQQIPTCQITQTKKRKYDKKHCCLYCGKYYAKMARHLEQCHKNEAEVACILSHPKNTKIRKAKFLELLKKGDFNHNREVWANKEGSLIPRKRQKEKIMGGGNSHLPCAHCFGVYNKKDLWRHIKKCKARSNDKATGTSNAQVAGRLLLPVSEDVASDFRNLILNTMLDDEVFQAVIKDSSILALGQRFFQKCKSQPHQFNYVKQKMREVGRFLLSMRKIRSSASISLRDCIDPTCFRDIVEAVRQLCKCNETGQFATPSLGLKVGHSLKKIALLLKSLALQTGDDELKEKASDFLELYTSDWASEISTFCLETLHTQTFNKPKRIPLAEDIKSLSNYLEEQASTLKEKLDDVNLSSEIWQELNEVTLAQLVLFNRRRAGETERIHKSQYEKGLLSRTEMQAEIASGLSLFEQKLASTLTRIEIRGKRGRKVPVLLTMKHKERIDCLLKYREKVDVNPDNPFLFPRSGNLLSCLRSCDVLRKYARKCGASQPHLLSSTSLRKHIATISQILNLKNHELDALAGFLGHDINVHRNFYRLPEDTVQLAKVGKILHELDNGCIAKHKGKSLDEIEIDENEEIDLDQDDSDDEDENATTNGICSLEEENELRALSQTAEEQPGIKSKKKERKLRKTISKACSLDDGKEKEIASQANVEQSVVTSRKKQRQQATKRPWNAEEKAAINRHLSKFFTLNRLPGKNEILDVQRKEPVLLQRPWQQMKYFIKNMKHSPKFMPS